MRNKVLICITIMILAFSLGGCGDAKTHRTESEIRGWREVLYDDTVYSISAFKDPYTDVEYIVICTGQGIAITPRLNADGTLYNEKK